MVFYLSCGDYLNGYVHESQEGCDSEAFPTSLIPSIGSATAFLAVLIQQ